MMGIPTLKSSRRSTTWIDGMSSLQMPLGSSLGRVWIEDETIAEARNALCQAALDANVELLFMLGDDVVPPPNALLMLLSKIGREFEAGRAAMITGVYWTKTYPPEPYLFNDLLKGTYKDWKAGEFFPVDMAGCDCLLIETDVLRAIPKPWFSTDWAWEPGQKSSPIATEDFYFYTKARKAGYRLYADTSIQCWHEDRDTGAFFGLSMEMAQAEATSIVGDGDVAVADVGCGTSTLTTYFGPNTKIVRFDQRAEVKPDVRCDIANIDEHWFGKFDYVCASHVLEHFRRGEAPNLIKHWVQLLKPNGELHVYVPNLERAFKLILNPTPDLTPVDKNYLWAQIYGDQAKPGTAWEHKNGFTARKLEALLRSSVPEFGEIKVEEMHDGLNLFARAKLTKTVEPEVVSTEWFAIRDRENGHSEVKDDAPLEEAGIT